MKSLNLVSPEQAAKILQLNPETVKRRIRSGEWPYYKLGERALRLDIQEILYLVKVEATK